MVHKEYNWIPGLYKCFDEGIVNARDHQVRMEQKISNGEENCIPVKVLLVLKRRLESSQ